jgi:hypothetical protein
MTFFPGGPSPQTPRGSLRSGLRMYAINKRTQPPNHLCPGANFFFLGTPSVPPPNPRARFTRQSISHRTSWGILPQTPVFSLRSAHCHWYTSITSLTEHRFRFYNDTDEGEGGSNRPCPRASDGSLQQKTLNGANNKKDSSAQHMITVL